MVKTLIHVVDIVYALLLIGGGAMGYAKAKSKGSLIGGLATGVLAVVAALLYHHHPRVGLGLAFIVGLAVEGIFFSRYQKTKNPMPAIPMIIASVIVQIVQIVVFAKSHG